MSSDNEKCSIQYYSGTSVRLKQLIKERLDEYNRIKKSRTFVSGLVMLQQFDKEDCNNYNDSQRSNKLLQWFCNFKSRSYPDLNKFITADRKKKQLPRAGIIMICDDRILTVTGRETKKTGFPKGRIVVNDSSLLTAALRELSEETGISLSGDAQFKCLRILNCFYFVCNISESVRNSLVLMPSDTFEIFSVQWCRVEDLQKMSCNRGLLDFLRKII